MGIFDKLFKKEMKTPYYKGSKKDFNKYISGYARNLVQNITKKYKKEVGKCEHCGVSNVELDAAHIHGRGRKDIIDHILNNSRGIEIVEVNLDDFEKMFIKAHKPINQTIKILCKKCHRVYDNISEQKTKRVSKIKETAIPNIKKTKEKLKIGRLVRTKMDELIENDLLSDQEIEKLQRADYSRDKLHIQYPLLKRALHSDSNNILRYWAGKKIIRGNEYFICSEWYEQPSNNDRPHFLAWYRTIIK